MSAEPTSQPATSVFDKFVAHPLRVPIMVAFSLFSIVTPVAVAWLDGLGDRFLIQGYWRPSWLPPAVAIYILAVSPVLARGEARVVEAFRPIQLTDDDTFQSLVGRASHLNPVAEVLSFGVGMIAGLWLGSSALARGAAMWLRWYPSFWTGLMYGLLGLSIYASVGSTRLIAELHRQPVRVDILDPEPFKRWPSEPDHRPGLYWRHRAEHSVWPGPGRCPGLAQLAGVRTPMPATTGREHLRSTALGVRSSTVRLLR